MSSKKHPTYSTAKTTDQILEAVARAVWWKEHSNAQCPTHKVPSEVELRDFVIKENQRIEFMNQFEHLERPDFPWPTESEEPTWHLDMSKHSWQRQMAKLVEGTLGRSCHNVSLEATSDVPGTSPDVFGSVMILVWVEELLAAPELSVTRDLHTGERSMLLLSIPELHSRLHALPKGSTPATAPVGAAGEGVARAPCTS